MRVLRVFAFVVLVCLAATVASAQTFEVGQLSWGVKVGVNIPSVPDFGPTVSTATGPVTYERMAQPVLGGFVVVPLGPQFGIQPEVLYSGKGSKFTQAVTNFGPITSTVNLDYLAFPILGRFTISPGNDRSGYILAGPEFAFRVRARLQGESVTNFAQGSISDEIKRVDLGLAVGGGYEIKPFQLEARFTQGLTNINTASTFNNKNRVFSFMAGVRF